MLVQEAELGGDALQIEGLFSVVLANSQEERYRGSLQLAQYGTNSSIRP